jgi:uridine phosphorylase
VATSGLRIAELARHGDTPQLVADADEYTFLEGILARARGTRLEVSAHETDLPRPQLAVEKLVHATKHLFAGIAIQW